MHMERKQQRPVDNSNTAAVRFAVRDGIFQVSEIEVKAFYDND